MTYYKFLTAVNEGEYSGFNFTDYLPKDGQAGEWLPEVKELSLCNSGYHACEKKDIASWINAQLYEVELGERMLAGDNKIVSNTMRFVRKIEISDKTFRLFACWCAEQVLHFFEEKCPDDNRPREAIRVSRAYAIGNATYEELSVAWSAAWSAARSAAADADAARSAAWSAYSDKFMEMIGEEHDRE